MSGTLAYDQVELSLVTPMYDEAATVNEFVGAVVPVLERAAPSYEIICVNDGSRDATLEFLRQAHAANPRIKIVNLSRNFGKEAALSAGIDYASGQAVIPIDADLQDPPEVIEKMLAKWREGYEVVLAARADRSNDSMYKRLTARLFYRLMGGISEVPIPENVGDFRLIDRRVVDALVLLPERTRFMKGLFVWPGFRHATVTYARPARASGATKWRFWSLWNFAVEGIVSFTTLPLKVWSYVGFACAALAMAYLVYIIARTIILGVDVPGYASLLSVVLFFNGLIMISLGILGEYVARVFIEVKGRPLYLVHDTIGFETDPRAAPAPSGRRLRIERP